MTDPAAYEPYRCPAKRGNNLRFQRLSPEIQGRNLDLTVLYVPYSLNSVYSVIEAFSDEVKSSQVRLKSMEASDPFRIQGLAIQRATKGFFYRLRRNPPSPYGTTNRRVLLIILHRSFSQMLVSPFSVERILLL